MVEWEGGGGMALDERVFWLLLVVLMLRLLTSKT